MQPIPVTWKLENDIWGKTKICVCLGALFIARISKLFLMQKERLRGLLRNMEICLILFAVLGVVDSCISISVWIFKFRYRFNHWVVSGM